MLVKYLALRRSKQDSVARNELFPILPSRVDVFEWLELGPLEREAYNSMEKHAQKLIFEIIGVNDAVLFIS